MGVSASHQGCGGAAATLASRGCRLSTPRSRPLGQTASAEDLLSVQSTKKKRRSGLSTLKRRLVGRKKNLRSADHAKHFKEAFSDKPAPLLSALLEHYEVLLAMRDLRVQADLARPPAPTLQQDLELLFTAQHCPDFTLTYQGTHFPVHKSILLARCPYFKDLLLAAGSLTTEVTVRLATPGVATPMLGSLLRFLYTGEYPSQEMSPRQIDLLISLGRECGVPNLLEADLEHLHLSGAHTDCILVFTGGGEKGGGERSPVQLSCHKAILCARSPFFRNLVSRRLQAAVQERAPAPPLRIVLDETVIPQKYARVLVRALYVDSIDFDLVDDHSPAEMGERVRDAMELYQIGRFLDLDILSQNCEDAIVQRLNPANICEVLEWSGQPYGSAWVHRQAHQFLLEDFPNIAASPALERLGKDTMKLLLTSDFLQASEAEVVAAVVRWGEVCVARRGEGEHCSLPANPGKRGGRRREGVTDREVAEAVCDLVACVRMEQLLPPGGGEVVRQAAERGILTRPWYMTSSGGGGGHSGAAESWDPRGYRPPHTRPRLFLPYYEECKALLSERTGALSGDTSSFNFQRMSEIPDTLYMVGREGGDVVGGRGAGQEHPALPDQDNVSQMVRRVRKLYRSISVQRAIVSPFCSRQQIFLQLQLRVVREYNLPDSFSAVLQRAMEGAWPDTPDPEHQENWGDRRAEYWECAGAAPQHPVPDQQPLSDMMPDIALAGAELSALSLSRSAPSPRPLGPLALSPDLVEQVHGGSSSSHSYRHGPSHMFL